MMSEERKNHFNLYKYLCFPWGVFVLTPFWYGIVFKAIDILLSKIVITTTSGTAGIPWWCSWALFAVGEIAIVAFLAIYSFSLPQGKKHSHNVYILIAPESFIDDKYITNDFTECFERYAKSSIENLNVIVPAALKREVFNRRVNRNHRRQTDFWTSKTWKKLHKKLRGSLYISGTLKRRLSEGKERFVFSLSATIGYNEFNKDIVPLMINELKSNFPQRILINKEFELEEFERMSSRFATFTEYLIGWAHLVSGNIMQAYKMHFDIYTNKKQSFFKRGALNDLAQLLHIEIDAVLKECKKYPLEFVSACVESAGSVCPNTDTSTLMVARFLIMTSTDDTFESNLSQAQSLLSQARINSHNRDVVHANRAYVSLLKGNYPKAESEYRSVFKKPNNQVLENIVEYCNGQILDGCSKERPTAYYVKALILFHLNSKEKEVQKSIEKAQRSIPSDFGYYHDKLHEMALQFQDGNIKAKSTERKKRHQQLIL